jgi:hypothetical protein
MARRRCAGGISMTGKTAMTQYGIPHRSFRSGGERPLPVNWRRGLFRIWLMFCAAWVMGWSIYLVIYGIYGGFKTTDDALGVAVLLSGPPIAMLLFGLVTGWAFRGFKS